MKRPLHWQMAGYTTVKNEHGQYHFRGTSKEELKAKVEDQIKKIERHQRSLNALLQYLGGDTESNPDAMR